MSKEFVNIERTNNPKPVCVTNESLHREFFFDVDSNIPFWKITAPTTLVVGCLYDFTWKLNEDDCSCEGDTATYLIVKAESNNVYYLVEFLNNKIYKTSGEGYSLYLRCHAKDIIGFDLNSFEYKPELESYITKICKYKVVDETGKDITDEETWVLLPNGELMFLDYGDLTGCPSARAVLLNE